MRRLACIFLLAAIPACVVDQGAEAPDEETAEAEQASSYGGPVNLHIGDMSQPLPYDFARVIRFVWTGTDNLTHSLDARPGDSVTIPCTSNDRLTVKYKLKNAFYSPTIPAGTATNFRNYFKIVNQFPVEFDQFVPSISGGIANGTTVIMTMSNMDTSALPRNTSLSFSLILDIAGDVSETNESDNAFTGGSIRFNSCP